MHYFNKRLIMKTLLTFAVLLLILLNIGCGHNVQKTDISYTPPVIKFQPRLFYPREAQDNSYFGTSKILVLISKTGTTDKVFITKSSGYNLLDSSAISYCKNMTFTPATKQGEPIASRMEFTIKFDLTNVEWVSSDYVEDIKSLTNIIKDADPADREKYQTEVLNWHNQFVENMRDLKNFNSTVQQVISPELASEWKNDLNNWPLSFLVYHDFLQKYQDFSKKDEVKKLLQNALNYDVYYIKNSLTSSDKERHEKDNLLIKIKGFINSNYPDILLNETTVFSKISS